MVISMRIILLITVICLSLLSIPALAQLDSGPSGIGVYADMGGMVNSVMQDEGLLEVYLLLMGCEAEIGIQAWEASIWVDGSLTMLGYELPYEGFTIGVLPDITVGVSDGGANDPLFTEPIMHLATLHFIVQGPEQGNIYIKANSAFGGSGSMGNYLPAYADAASVGGLFAMYPSSGSVDQPVFRVNGESPVATTVSPFAGVKALYR